MTGDFSKFKHPLIISREHNYQVLRQQGRVSLDQDYNEESQISAYKNETTITDIVGKSGASLDNAGFKIEAILTTSPPASPIDGEIKISTGHYYVDGILCENDEDIAFESQQDYPSATLPSTPGNYLFYLDVWLRHMTAWEDKTLREVALGGPDTTTRTKVVWQVKCIDLVLNSSALSPDCSSAIIAEETNSSTGTLSATSQVIVNSDNPCDPTVSGGYRRLQNQLYRVEMHKGGDATNATFKWSRDNGSIVTKWQSYNSSIGELTVSSLGKDELLGFNAGDWIEIIDDTTDLLNQPGILVQLTIPPKNNIISVDPNNTSLINTLASFFNPKRNPRIRKWDSQGELPVQLNKLIDLEDGVQINFGIAEFENTFLVKNGDYWLIPARPAIADVEWEKDASDNPLFLPPFGIQHHYAKLAIAKLDATTGWSLISDCRNIFAPLTEQTALYYVGGDGQEGTANSTLPEPLMVGVANGSLAVSGARVKFDINPGAGSLSTPADGILFTGDDGIATCNWTLGNSAGIPLKVTASLVDEQGLDVPQKLPVIFSAGFSGANNNVACCEITIGTNGNYKTLNEAINELAKLKQPNKDLNVSLCLLAEDQDHLIDENENIDMSEMGFQILHITGKASHITMKAKSIVLAADKKIILEGFSLDTSNDRNQVLDPQSILISTNQLTVDHCSFTRNGVAVDAQGNPSDNGVPGQANTPFFYVNNKNTTVYLSDNAFLGFFSLVLENGVQGIIEKNIITLLLLQSGSIGKFTLLPVFWTASNPTTGDPGTKKTARQVMQADQFLFPWSLAIKGNYVGGIITNTTGFIYLSIIISENVFNLPAGLIINNSFIAQHLTIVNNQFLYIPPQNTPSITVAFVACLSAVITGNMGRPARVTLSSSIIDVIKIWELLADDPPLNLLQINTAD